MSILSLLSIAYVKTLEKITDIFFNYIFACTLNLYIFFNRFTVDNICGYVTMVCGMTRRKCCECTKYMRQAYY